MLDSTVFVHWKHQMWCITIFINTLTVLLGPRNMYMVLFVPHKLLVEYFPSIIYFSMLIIHPRLSLSLFKYVLWMGFLLSTIQVLFPLSPPTLYQPSLSLEHPCRNSISVFRQAFPSFPHYESPFPYFHNVKFYCGQFLELSPPHIVISTQSFFFIDLLLCKCFWLKA